MDNTTTITITVAGGTALLKAIGKAMQTCELEMQRFNGTRRENSRQEWLALDEVLDQLQDAKHDFYSA